MKARTAGSFATFELRLRPLAIVCCDIDANCCVRFRNRSRATSLADTLTCRYPAQSMIEIIMASTAPVERRKRVRIDKLERVLPRLRCAFAVLLPLSCDA